jgi:SAM-dependent methyltransferase
MAETVGAERGEYLKRQRKFWEVDDLAELKFNRVDTLYGEDRTEEKFNQAADERVGWILGGLNLPSQPAILEIGCGIGAVIERVRRKLPTAEVWGFDISSTMIAEARRRLGGDTRVHLEITEGDSLGNMPDESVDLVICSGVFIHILDIGVIRSYIREACRVLRRGGAFRFNARYWDPSRAFSDGPGGKLAKFLHRIGWHSSLKPGRIHTVTPDFKGLLFTLDEMQRLLTEAGLVAEQFSLQVEDASPGVGYIRVNCHRPGR